MLLLASDVLLLLLARNDVVEEDLLPLPLDVSLAFLAQLHIFVTLHVQLFVLLLEPLVLEVEIVLLPLGNLLSAIMRVHGLLEGLFSAFLINLQFAHA